MAKASRPPFTKLTITNLKPTPGKQVDYWDGGYRKLLIKVSPGGKKAWRVAYYDKVKKKTTQYGLGHFGPGGLSVKQARKAAETFQPEVTKSGTFKEVAEDEFLKRHVYAQKLRSADDIKRIIDVLIMPKWKGKVFEKLTRTDVTKLLDEVEDKNGSRQADIVLAILRKMCNFYASRHDSYSSPIVKGMNRSKSPKKVARTLENVELRALWKVAPQLGNYGALLQMLVLTGQRRDKVATMKWADVGPIILDAGSPNEETINDVWTIQTVAREKGNGGMIRLSPMAMEIITAQRERRVAGNAHVFPAGSGKGPMRGWSKLKPKTDRLMLKEVPGMKPWTVHELRKTTRSLMAKVGVADALAERVLGHKQPSAASPMTVLYNLHRYVHEKSDALDKLASHVRDIVSPPPANVVGIGEARRLAAPVTQAVRGTAGGV